jgi:hypothetical protein
LRFDALRSLYPGRSLRARAAPVDVTSISGDFDPTIGLAITLEIDYTVLN